MTSSSGDGQQRTLILGMGNPLLDKQILTADTQLHEKYGLTTDSAYLVLPHNQETLLPIFKDIEQQREAIEHVPGGSAQNTMRVFQWLVPTFGGPKQKAAAYFGAVGTDENAELLEKLATQAGLDVHYQKVADVKTGVCAVLIHGAERCLIAYLGAAEHFTVDHLNKEENKQLIKAAENYYIEGYYLTHCLEGVLLVAKEAAAANKPFAMNLSSDYICSMFLAQLNQVLPYVDVLFGNQQEANAYAEQMKFDESEKGDLGKIALRIADYDKVNKKRGRTVVITSGADPVLIAHEGKLLQFAVHPIEKDLIEDTNGAGDAFCGGFLAAMTCGQSLEESVKAGNYAARMVIQNSGCTFPPDCDYDGKK